MKLPPCVPDHLWLVVRKGWTLAMGLVAAIKARCPQLERGVQADAVGLSLRTFGAAERELGGASIPVEKQDMALRQRLSTAQLWVMRGTQVRRRVAAAIVETAVDNPEKQWSLAGAAAAVGMQRRTISRAKLAGRPCRAIRRSLEANAPHHGTVGETPLVPEPPAIPFPDRKFSPALHERNPEADTLVPAWKITALLRGLILAKGRGDKAIVREIKPGAQVLAELERIGPLGRGQRWGEADLLLEAAGVHDHGRFAHKRIKLARALARAAAPLEALRQVALRLARNPNVANVAAILVQFEIGLWMLAGSASSLLWTIQAAPHRMPTCRQPKQPNQ